jgi:hypothetical protein
MKRTILAVAALALLLTASPRVWAGPANAAHISADAKWYVHLDMDIARTTEIFKVIREELNAKFPLEDTLAQLRQLLGFDPIQEIKGISLFATTFDPGNATILVYGKLDQASLRGLLANNPDFQETTRGKHVILTWSDKGKTPAGCFYNPDLILIGERADVVLTALDALDSGKNSCPLVRQPTDGTFLSGGATDLKGIKDKGLSQFAEAADGLTLSAGEREGKLQINAAVNFKTPEVATQMKQLADGLKALVMLNAKKSPVTAATVGKVVTSQDGSRVSLSFDYETKTLLQTIKTMVEEKQNQDKATEAVKTDPAK